MRTDTPLMPPMPPFSSMPKRRRKRIPGVRRRGRFSPLLLVGVIITIVVGLGAGTYFVVLPHMGSHAANAADPNMDCTLIVPANPLSAQGLATPYQLVATDPNNGPCNESNAGQAAFVQGTIFDFNTGQMFVYNPLVIDQGTKAAIAPVVPQLPKNAAVALWFGFNGNNLTLQSTNNSLKDGQCVNGSDGSIFGQFAYCNAPYFFGLVNEAIIIGRLTPPSLGTAKDGQPCPSLRDFGLVDQDQSDNVTTGYLITKNGQAAQLTAANQMKLPGAQPMTNGSDNGLLDAFVDPALGCTPWMAPDLANQGQMTTALALNEVQAMVHQKAPVALVPLNDPMTLDGNGNFNLTKTNIYRFGVDQPRAQNNNQADPKAYCQNLVNTGAPRIVLDAPLTVKMTTPDPATGNNLFTFLGQRFVNSYMNLNCQKLLGTGSPLATTQDGNGVAVSVSFKGQPVDTSTGGTSGSNPDCNVNGQTVKGCTGTTNVNDQTCTFSFSNNTVTENCKAKN